MKTVEVVLDQEAVERFFAWARERHAIYLRRQFGESRPWTVDPVMSSYRITNVFRELDKTTKWLRKNVRGPHASSALVLPAVALFRWFNTIRTGETLFSQPSLYSSLVPPAADPAGVAGGRVDAAATLAAPYGGAAPAGAVEYKTPWEQFLETEDVEVLSQPLRKQGAPWVTGAYLIRTPIGLDKMEGVLTSFLGFWRQRPKFELNDGKFVSMGWRDVAEYCIDAKDGPTPVTLRRVWDWLNNFYGLGPFMAYEIVTDLRHTALLRNAPDINTWSNPGPGALRGSNLMIRGVNRGRKGRLDKSSYPEANATLLQLLELSRSPRYWPQQAQDVEYEGFVLEEVPNVFGNGVGQIGEELLLDGFWPTWELHEPEMWTCEYAKLERTRLGFSRPRGNY